MSCLALAPTLAASNGHECDYCGLRMARATVGSDNACSECAVSRLARIAACAKRLRRHAEVAEVGTDETDVVGILEGLE